MTSIPRPDLSERPSSLDCERLMKIARPAVYEAWTTGFDLWFAQAGTLDLVPEPGRPYFFYNRDEWGRHPHYGRILDVRPGEFVEMTWMTGNGNAEGTEGAETMLRIELEAEGDSTRVRLTHSGFPNDRSRDAHAENWPIALEILESSISTP